MNRGRGSELKIIYPDRTRLSQRVGTPVDWLSYKFHTSLIIFLYLYTFYNVDLCYKSTGFWIT